jgi:hypothetical protein
MTLFLWVLLHQVAAPDRTSHYVKITCLEDRIRIAYTILYGDQPAAEERRRIDVSGDGTLDESELARFDNAVAREVAPAVRLEVDGHAVPLRFQAAVGLGSERGVVAAPFSLDLTALTPVAAAAEHEIWVDDRWEPARAGETHVEIEESPGTRVVASWDGHQGAGPPRLRWTFDGARRSDLEDRSLGFRVRTFRAAAATLAARDRRQQALWAILSVLAGIGLGLVMLSRARVRRGYLDSMKG